MGIHCPDCAKAPGSATADVWAAVPDPNTIPPAVGRTKVWMASLTLSSAGILSATTSMTSRTATIVITQPFSSQAQPCGKDTRSVKRDSRPSASSGMSPSSLVAVASAKPVSSSTYAL